MGWGGWVGWNGWWVGGWIRDVPGKSQIWNWTKGLLRMNLMSRECVLSCVVLMGVEVGGWVGGWVGGYVRGSKAGRRVTTATVGKQDPTPTLPYLNPSIHPFMHARNVPRRGSRGATFCRRPPAQCWSCHTGAAPSGGCGACRTSRQPAPPAGCKAGVGWVGGLV